jgi:hypothetical protein
MHHRARRLLAVAAAGSVLATIAAPAAAGPGADAAAVQVVHDPSDDLTNEMWEKVDVPEARGLDVLAVRQRLIGNRLIVVSRHKNLTKRNSNVNPDRTPVKGSFSMFAAYLEPRPHGMSGYTVSFDRNRKARLTYHPAQGEYVPCPVMAERSRIDLERDRVRYVIPLSCIPNLAATRTTAQVIRYKVIRRTNAGIEHIAFSAIDQNDRPTPRFRLR